MKTWTLAVEEVDGESVITFPQDLLDAVQWQIGDTLTWDINDQGHVTLTKKDADGKD